MNKSTDDKNSTNPSLRITHVSGSALIAKFMGYRVEKVIRKHTFDSNKNVTDYKAYHNEQLIMSTPETLCNDVETHCWDFIIRTVKYHKSWDYLMPVYRKIRDILNERSKYDKHTRTEYNLLELDAQMAICEVNIEKAFISIVKFIEFWNVSKADR